MSEKRLDLSYDALGMGPTEYIMAVESSSLERAPAKRRVALEIVRRLQGAGFAAYWVGGCVRDFLRGVEPQDYDIATAAPPEEMEGLFPHTIPVGRRYGILLVVDKGFRFEVATFRTEADYSDGRHPNRVTFSDAVSDARRRDFTVNGLFYDPVGERFHDWVGGVQDLRSGIIRTIGHPEERFAEDHLRLLRAIRFAAQLNYDIETATLAAIRALAPSILSVSAERIREELLKLFRPPHAARGLDLLHQSGLLTQVLPEVATTTVCEQSPVFHPEGTVFQHIRLMLAHVPSEAPTALPWAVLLHDVGKPPALRLDASAGSAHFYGHEKIGAELAGHVLGRLKFPRKLAEQIVACVRFHMQFKDVIHMRKSTLRRFLMRPTFPLELELHRLDCLGSHGKLDVFDFLAAQAALLKRTPHLHPPLLTGKDLMALGVRPGPAMGTLLKQIREKQLQDELTTRDAALDWVQSQFAVATGIRLRLPGSATQRSRRPGRFQAGESF